VQISGPAGRSAFKVYRGTRSFLEYPAGFMCCTSSPLTGPSHADGLFLLLVSTDVVTRRNRRDPPGLGRTGLLRLHLSEPETLTGAPKTHVAKTAIETVLRFWAQSARRDAPHFVRHFFSARDRAPTYRPGPHTPLTIRDDNRE
jgi:hypothetical protein